MRRRTIAPFGGGARHHVGIVVGVGGAIRPLRGGEEIPLTRMPRPMYANARVLVVSKQGPKGSQDTITLAN